jgi:hypothetical protein
VGQWANGPMGQWANGLFFTTKKKHNTKSTTTNVVGSPDSASGFRSPDRPTRTAGHPNIAGPVKSVDPTTKRADPARTRPPGPPGQHRLLASSGLGAPTVQAALPALRRGLRALGVRPKTTGPGRRGHPGPL